MKQVRINCNNLGEEGAGDCDGAAECENILLTFRSFD